MSRANQIVLSLGPKIAMALVSAAGGTRVRVPATLARAAHLRSLIGDEMTVVVIERLSGLDIYIPRGDTPRPVNSSKIADFTARGWSARKIARELKCSTRVVHKKRAAIRALVEEVV